MLTRLLPEPVEPSCVLRNRGHDRSGRQPGATGGCRPRGGPSSRSTLSFVHESGVALAHHLRRVRVPDFREAPEPATRRENLASPRTRWRQPNAGGWWKRQTESDPGGNQKVTTPVRRSISRGRPVTRVSSATHPAPRDGGRDDRLLTDEALRNRFWQLGRRQAQPSTRERSTQPMFGILERLACRR